MEYIYFYLEIKIVDKFFKIKTNFILFSKLSKKKKKKLQLRFESRTSDSFRIFTVQYQKNSFFQRFNFINAIKGQLLISTKIN